MGFRVDFHERELRTILSVFYVYAPHLTARTRFQMAIKAYMHVCG